MNTDWNSPQGDFDTAEKQGEENYPLHSGRFDIQEEVLWKSVAALHSFLMREDILPE